MTSDSNGRKKIATIVAEISRVSEALVGSVKANRKSWEEQLQEVSSSIEQKEKHVTKNKIDMQSLIRTQVRCYERLAADSLFIHFAEFLNVVKFAGSNGKASKRRTQLTFK